MGGMYAKSAGMVLAYYPVQDTELSILVYAMHQISVPLNRQQLELLDRTLAQGVAADRAELLKLALREFMARAQAKPPVAPTEPRR